MSKTQSKRPRYAQHEDTPHSTVGNRIHGIRGVRRGPGQLNIGFVQIDADACTNVELIAAAGAVVDATVKPQDAGVREQMKAIRNYARTMTRIWRSATLASGGVSAD